MSNRVHATETCLGAVTNSLHSWCAMMFVLVCLILVGARVSLADTDGHSHLEHSHMIAAGQWEGSAEGIAYSEFNHALAGLGVILIGLTELHTAMGWTALVWSRWLLPVALVSSGVFLLIWSDHEAWPIGSWTLAETLSGKDPEMLQHKIFGVLALGVGIVEWLRRAGSLGRWVWSAMLPGFALFGGGMLFLHMHGPHPAGHQIQIHHDVMGTLALAGGMAWFAGECLYRPQNGFPQDIPSKSIFKILWAIVVLVIGVQLLFYSES